MYLLRPGSKSALSPSLSFYSFLSYQFWQHSSALFPSTSFWSVLYRIAVELLSSTHLHMGGHLRPDFRKYPWPAVGSLECMRQWTFEQGAASLQTRAHRYGRQPEAPPLSPKSRLVHIALEEPLASPTTVLNRAPLYGDDAPRYNKYSNDLDNGRLRSLLLTLNHLIQFGH